MIRKILYATSLIFLISCSNKVQEMKEFTRLYESEQDLQEMMKKIQQTPIYFGHRSVGNNILGGVKQLEEASGVRLNMVETKEFSGINSPAFVHFNIGENGDPEGKIDAFVSAVSNIPEDSSSIAFFKFCFADIKETTQIDPLFNYYKEKMLELKARYPRTKIILVTIPYVSIQKGIKALIKRVLRMPLGGQIDNKNRSEFNRRMLNELGDDFPLFDLARIESTLPDGVPNRYEFKNTEYPSLAYIYTHDLCHLNDYGSRIAASNLIAFLANELNN